MPAERSHTTQSQAAAVDQGSSTSASAAAASSSKKPYAGPLYRKRDLLPEELWLLGYRPILKRPGWYTATKQPCTICVKEERPCIGKPPQHAANSALYTRLACEWCAQHKLRCSVNINKSNFRLAVDESNGLLVGVSKDDYPPAKKRAKSGDEDKALADKIHASIVAFLKQAGKPIFVPADRDLTNAGLVITLLVDKWTGKPSAMDDDMSRDEVEQQVIRLLELAGKPLSSVPESVNLLDTMELVAFLSEQFPEAAVEEADQPQNGDEGDAVPPPVQQPATEESTASSSPTRAIPQPHREV